MKGATLPNYPRTITFSGPKRALKVKLKKGLKSLGKKA